MVNTHTPVPYRLYAASTPHNHTYRYDKDQEAPHARYPKRLVSELKEELEARDQPKTGNKAWLRRRLHGAIVRAHLAERDREP